MKTVSIKVLQLYTTTSATVTIQRQHRELTDGFWSSSILTICGTNFDNTRLLAPNLHQHAHTCIMSLHHHAHTCIVSLHRHAHTCIMSSASSLNMPTTTRFGLAINYSKDNYISVIRSIRICDWSWSAVAIRWKVKCQTMSLACFTFLPAVCVCVPASIKLLFYRLSFEFDCYSRVRFGGCWH